VASLVRRTETHGAISTAAERAMGTSRPLRFAANPIEERPMATPRELQGLYEAGENLTALLRAESGADHNEEQVIELAYEFQTGSYVRLIETDPGYRESQRDWTAALVDVLRQLGPPRSLLEAGIGEGTTLAGLVETLGDERVEVYGFDLSWSRVACARRWLAQRGLEVSLCTGSLLHLPFADDSVDVVFTSHAIEPNGGREEPILRELHRVAREYVVMLEPAYEFASEDVRRRMDAHGYCRNLAGAAQSLGFAVERQEPFAGSTNDVNPSAITVLEKRSTAPRPGHVLACPRFHTPLEEHADGWYSPEAMAVYPKLLGLPCLRIENAITATKFRDHA
jgi:SAM-dependent methyltransferase